MLRIGLTGNIGSGKSTVASIFNLLGVPLFYADIEAHNALNLPNTINSLTCLFGRDVLNHNGQIDRQRIGKLVFNDPSKLSQLNSIIHPLVRARFDAWCHLHSNNHMVIQEAAILYESGHYKYFDRMIVVSAPENVRINRVMLRDNLDYEAVVKRIKAQWSEDQKTSLADYIIVNDGQHMIVPQVINIWNELNAL